MNYRDLIKLPDSKEKYLMLREKIKTAQRRGPVWEAACIELEELKIRLLQNTEDDNGSEDNERRRVRRVHKLL